MEGTARGKLLSSGAKYDKEDFDNFVDDPDIMMLVLLVSVEL